MGAALPTVGQRMSPPRYVPTYTCLMVIGDVLLGSKVSRKYFGRSRSGTYKAHFVVLVF